MHGVTARSLDEWEALVAESFYPLAVRGGPDDFTAALRRVDLPFGVRIAEVSTDSVHLRRDGRMVKTSSNDDLLLLLKVEGSSRAESGRSVVRVPPGGALIFDPRHPYDVITEGRSLELVVTCPRTLLSHSLQGSGEAIGRVLPETSMSVRALSGLLTELAVADTHSADPEELSTLSSLVVDLLGSLVRSSSEAREELHGSTESQLRALQRYALRELASPELTVESMAAAHGVSARHVGAVFQKAGLSPASFIRNERLARARADLESPRHAHRAISEIARAWGFYDMTTFARAFRRAFDITPTEARRPDRPR